MDSYPLIGIRSPLLVSPEGLSRLPEHRWWMPGPRAHWEGGARAGDPFAVTPKGQGEIPGALVPSLAAIPAGMRKQVPTYGAPTYESK